MKTTFLKSLAIVAVTASFYAVTVAFTTVSNKNSPRFEQSDAFRAQPATIEQWVTRKLGFPKMLDRSEENVPVMIRLHVDHQGRVDVLNCQADWPELEEYITFQLNGIQASIDQSQFDRDFEIKINFRHM
ncbi:MAG: hypothetical protein RLZZ262_890 [Bacteroidota bacterium]|jgi:hypothetical protein